MKPRGRSTKVQISGNQLHHKMDLGPTNFLIKKKPITLNLDLEVSEMEKTELMDHLLDILNAFKGSGSSVRHLHCESVM